jgi:hypothetical protein
MTDVLITMATGRTVTFTLPPAGDGPPTFALSVRKCGSSIFNNMAQALAEHNGYGFVDVGGTLFEQNVRALDWQEDPALADLIRPGYLFGGFRDMPTAWLKDERFMRHPKMLMVRDPRDALVSDYFSTQFSHRIPEASDGHDDMVVLASTKRSIASSTRIDDWVLQEAAGFNRTMMSYAPLVDDALTKVVTYEEYIFAKEALLRLMAEHFSWRVDDGVIADILEWADVRPDAEDPHKFIRKVTPGDHREKLNRITRSRLRIRVGPSMELYGYR